MIVQYCLRGILLPLSTYLERSGRYHTHLLCAGPSKKLAKTAAARSALSTLYDFNFNVPNIPTSNDVLNPTPPPFITLASYQADVIAKYDTIFRLL